MFAKQKGLDESKADERFFETSGSTNKEVANILDSNSQSEAPQTSQQPQVKLEEAAWGEEEELDIDDDIMGADSNAMTEGTDQQADSDIFVPPSAGADPLLQVLR